jgi:hypothetical protein
MCQIITSFIGPIVGGLVVGGIGIWMSRVNRHRDGKQAFLLVAADQKSKLSETKKKELDKFYQQSVPIMSQAVYRVLEFLKEEQKCALLKFWNAYRSEGEKQFGNQKEFLDAYTESMVGGNPLTYLKWLEDYFDKFDECIKDRKPKILPMKISLALLISVFLVGCAHSSFTPCTTQNGAIAREDALLPVYLSPPNIPYDVIGTINVETSRHRNPDKAASTQAMQQGANALILLNEGTTQVGTYHETFGNAQNFGNSTVYQSTGVSVPVRRKTASYFAIKFHSTSSTNQPSQ